MNYVVSLKKSVAAKLVLAFILVAVPPMLLASHVATSMVSSSANQGIANWLREASDYLFLTIQDTRTEIASVYSLLRPRFVQRVVSFSPEELQALSGLDVDFIVLREHAGKVLLSSPSVQSLDETPVYPGSSFYWANMKNGERVLTVAAQRCFTTEDGNRRVLQLASRFDIQLSETSGNEPVELRIFLPDGQGFSQEYSSSGSPAYALPAAALKSLQGGAEEYSLIEGDWPYTTPNTYFLFEPARDANGNILAVFSVSVIMRPNVRGIPGYNTLFLSFFAGGVLLSGCTGYFLARKLTRPIRRLHMGAREIASGNFTSRVSVDGSDEVAELSAGFNLMAAQLELMQRENLQSTRRERSRMLSEIALGFAHEIRNPLLVIKTSAELVHGKLPNDGKESRLLGFVVEEVGRIDSLISEFLAFAKPTPFKPEYFRLDVLTRDVLELSAAELAARGISYAFADATSGAHGVRILGEEHKIRQVLLNLVLNAMDAMPEGGSLILRLYEPKEGGRVCLEVKDTGIGIAESLLPTIHLPFISTKKNGLGLGLAKVHAIIEEHGGSITCVSAPGQGTTFTVCLNT